MPIDTISRPIPFVSSLYVGKEKLAGIDPHVNFTKEVTRKMLEEEHARVAKTKEAERKAERAERKAAKRRQKHN